MSEGEGGGQKDESILVTGKISNRSILVTNLYLPNVRLMFKVHMSVDSFLKLEFVTTRFGLVFLNRGLLVNNLYLIQGSSHACSMFICQFNHLIIGSISTTTPIFVPIRKNLNFTTHLPPPPPQCFLYLRETQANVLRGLQRF